ncbi:MAG TPA: phosphate ABC transporter substrate-binding protein PstS [Candidatus Nitrosotenuis sp.]
MKILAATLMTVLIASVFSQVAIAQNQFTITGAGATFPFPLLDLWRVKYNEAHPNINMNYQSIGSGGGVKQHVELTVNFAASDAPLTDGEMELAPDSLTIPEAIGGITVTYNIPEIPQSGLKLTGQQVADIFQGKITKWNDAQIQQTNPDLPLPDESILVAHRSDGSGTTYAFTEYLTMVSQDWDDQVGFGKSVPWPAGVGAAGNEGVATTVRTSPYSIGYVELAYAFQNNMAVAFVQNADGTAFVEPTFDTLSAAAAGAAAGLPAAHEHWQEVSINNSPGPNSYPIVSFTYILLHQNLEAATPSKAHAQETVNLIKWMITEGQKYNPELLYVPIPAEVTQLGLDGLDRVTYNGQPLFAEAAMEQPQDTQDAEGGGCLIATAAYGSEMASQVQLLREVRDNVLFSTTSGANFMTSFNSIYYSFSPTVADWERNNPAFKEVVKTAITPMLSTLSILNYVDIDSEQEMLGYGVGIILLNLGMYFVAPAIVIVKLRSKFNSK